MRADDGPGNTNQRRKKAAILVCLLGEDAASTVYKNLSDQDVERLTQEIGELQTINAQTALQILEEYHKLTLTQDYMAQGGSDYAKRLLVKAFGEDGARTLMDQVARAQEMSAGKLDSLQKSDPQQLAKFLESEHPQTIALILAHLDSKQACTLLMRLPETVRAEAVTRLAQLRQFSPDVAQKVSLVLHNRLQSLGEQSRRAYAGLKGVADMLNRLEPNAARSILEVIEKAGCEGRGEYTQPDVYLRGLSGRAGDRNSRTAGASRQEDAGDCFEGSVGGYAQPCIQVDVIARG